MSQVLILTCKIPGCGKRTEGTTGLCSSHNKALRQVVKAPISRVSKKLQANLSNYKEASRQWLIGKRCAVFPVLKATEIHHKFGRVGKDLMDKDGWLPVSRKGHIEIELHPDWARKMGFTVSRLTEKA
jgi:hypothetical protein